MTRYEHAGAAVPTTLTAGVDSSATSFTIADATGWPTGVVGPFFVVVDDGEASMEKVLVTSRSGTTLTVASRGVDGTAAQAHASAASIFHCYTATEADEANAHREASSGVHGVAGALVGTTDTQTLSGKSISGASNTLSAIPQSAVTNLAANIATLTAADTTLQNNINAEAATRSANDNANAAALTSHTGTSLAHGVVSGEIVGTDKTQTLTNKTINGSNNSLSNIPLTALVGANRQITFGEGAPVDILTGGGGSVGGFHDIPIGAQSSATGLAAGDITVASNIITVNRSGLYGIMVRIDTDSVAASDADFGLVIPGLFDAPGVPIERIGSTTRAGRLGGMVALVPLTATQTLYIQGSASGDTVNAVLRWLRFQQVYDFA